MYSVNLVNLSHLGIPVTQGVIGGKDEDTLKRWVRNLRGCDDYRKNSNKTIMFSLCGYYMTPSFTL